jgi:hypothetical protein
MGRNQPRSRWRIKEGRSNAPMGHIRMLPQRVREEGGYKVRPHQSEDDYHPRLTTGPRCRFVSRGK